MKYLSSLKTKNLSGKVCLLRADFNIAVTDSKLQISPNLRITSILPTIDFLIKRGAKVVILSHRGRPGKVSSIKYQVSNYTLAPFAEILSKLLKKPVEFIEFNKVNNLRKSDFLGVGNSVFLLENLRFNAGEEKNDKKFAGQLAKLGDFYVNEAFSVSHRKNASVEAITKFLPSYVGYSLENEIKNLSKTLKNPKKPLIVILGGVKIADKIGLIKNFWNKADKFLIGGGIANTFFAAQKMPMGSSIYEKNKIAFAKKLLKSPKIVLPVDAVVKDGKILDIGLETEKEYAKIINSAKTIIWNGPMGYIEDKKFKKGSEAVLKAIIKSKAFGVIGGGETTALLGAVNSKFEIRNSKLFISTGGGAMLEFLAGNKLPGIEALKNNKNR